MANLAINALQAIGIEASLRPAKGATGYMKHAITRGAVSLVSVPVFAALTNEETLMDTTVFPYVALGYAVLGVVLDYTRIVPKIKSFVRRLFVNENTITGIELPTRARNDEGLMLDPDFKPFESDSEGDSDYEIEGYFNHQGERLVNEAAEVQVESDSDSEIEESFIHQGERLANEVAEVQAQAARIGASPNRNRLRNW